MRRELITFEVCNQLFGLDIMAIREIRAWSPVTRLPKVPGHVVGVVNLRGVVLPVVDLAARLGWEPVEATPRNPIIVAEWEGQLRGLIVHTVNDIVTIDDETLQQPASGAEDAVSDCIEGLTTVDEEMLMVLELSKLADDTAMAKAA